jgi:hypothetical protein
MLFEKEWVRNPQEREGDYLFNGTMYCTTMVMNELGIETVSAIVHDLLAFANEKQGIDYLQVYERSDGLKVFCIDQLSQKMIKSGDYTPEQIEEYNHFTILFPCEY